ncbi:hypothetical protein LTR08_008982 [Meristemomyces frigidus]|nr:hypothetical protein LTR08_008982 [Meristemomyces frigidus]
MAEAAMNPFDNLPIETCQQIASYLDSERDLCHYRLTCQSTHDAVDADSCSFWRRRFLATFEKPTWSSGNNLRYKAAYQKRKRALMFGAKFEVALLKTPGKDLVRQVAKSVNALEVLRDLIVESFSEKKDDDVAYESANLSHITNFILNHDLLHVVMLAEKDGKDFHCIPKPLLQTIQVMLAPALLNTQNERFMQYSYGFPDSQMTVYGTALDCPIFGGCNNLDIRMDFLLHHLNFWKYHLRRDEHTLFSAFAALDAAEMPRFWRQQLKTGANQLGTHWKGSYAFVDHPVIKHVRAGKGQNRAIQDEFNGETDLASFQDLRLEFVPDEESYWPPVFEQHLKSLAPRASHARTRAQMRSATPEGLAGFKPQNFRFGGEGQDVTEEFCAQGWLNALPAQQGVAGWQRMTMMKYFQDEDGTVDMDALWAYEGVVLPGGQIIMGRWWSPGDGVGREMYSGPFLFFCVDGPTYEDAGSEEGECEGEGRV